MTQLKRFNGELIAESKTLTLRELAEQNKHDLEMANLDYADLGGARLAFSDLRMASLWGANLEGANLTEANLTGANLGWAKLEMAKLERANLDAANLRGVFRLWSALTPSRRIAYAVDHTDKIMWQIGCRWAETQEIIEAINADYADRPSKRDAYIAIIEAGVKVLESQREAQS